MTLKDYFLFCFNALYKSFCLVSRDEGGAVLNNTQTCILAMLILSTKHKHIEASCLGSLKNKNNMFYGATVRESAAYDQIMNYDKLIKIIEAT